METETVNSSGDEPVDESRSAPRQGTEGAVHKEVFGSRPLLPDTTRDESDSWAERAGDDPEDLERFVRDRPPHHGD